MDIKNLQTKNEPPKKETASVEDALKAHEKVLEQKLTEHETQIKEYGHATSKVSADLKKVAEDHKSIVDEMTSVKDSLTAIQQTGVKMESGERKTISIGEEFIKSETLAAYKEGRSGRARMETKNTITGETAGEPTNDIVPLQTMPGIVGGAFRMLRIYDVIPRGQATGNTVHYTRELSWTSSAKETAEAGLKSESALVFEGVDSPVRTIAHVIKASRQVLDDAPALMTYIDLRMAHGVQERLEYQLVNGNGTSPNISGILDDGNYTPATPLPSGQTESALDFASRIKYQVVASDYMPNIYLINPADWGAIERIKTTAGEYVAGYNALGYINNGLTPTLWGLPVIASNNIPEGKLISMATDATLYWERQGTVVEIFDQNEDDVNKNLITIRAEVRGAFSVFRPAAIVAGDIPTAA